METLLEVTDLCRRFGRHNALAGLDLNLARGEVLGLLGPNGAGKSTCLRILSGNLAPSRGRVSIAGIDLVRDPLRAKRHLGYLPERPPLYPELRIVEYLRFCARLHRVPRRRVDEAVAQAMSRCGLEDLGHRPIARLSKGYRQRLGIAQAILHRPRLLILDEPTEGLDPIQMREVRTLVRELSRDSGIILASHILPEVQAVCDRVAILHQGRLIAVDRLAPEDAARVRRLSFSAPVPAESLWMLPCVAGVETLADGAYRVRIAPGSAPEDLARAVVAAGWGLIELTAEQSGLERVFFDLVGAAEAV
jgi:ABC-2 type transport system ATP-binding protein